MFHQQCSSPPLCWSYGGFLCPLCACMHACKRGERGRDHMLGLSVQAAWSHSLWSAGVTVIRLWLFASLLINHGPLSYSTVRLYSILNCELINSSNCWNQRSFASFYNHVCPLMALTGKGLMFWVTEMLRTKTRRTYSSTSHLWVWRVVDGEVFAAPSSVTAVRADASVAQSV